MVTISDNHWRIPRYTQRMTTKPRHNGILELSHNGDPYGRGFTASESKDNGRSWFYRGDVGARSRAWWRYYARKQGYVLREAR